MKIKRYDLTMGLCPGDVDMREAPNGSWCRYENVKELERDLANTEQHVDVVLREKEKLEERIEELEKELEDEIEFGSNSYYVG